MTRLRCIALALVLIVGGIAWGIIIAHRGYDYDEVLRAHSIWLTSQGLRPYHEFFECHPPYFALLVPFVWGHADSGAVLITLRLVAVVGNLLFLAGLAFLAAVTGGGNRLIAVLGTALVAFHPAVLEFLGEFRIDGWGYALATWSIAWYLRSRRIWRHTAFGLATGIATLLFCPKLALLPILILIFEQLSEHASLKVAFRDFAMYAAGVGAAGGLFWCWLAVNGINLNLAFACMVKYNSLDNFRSGFGHGLLSQIPKMPTLSLPILVAFLTWAIHCIRAKSLPSCYPAALAIWLSVQAVLVSYHYKQYYAPWFLFASGFFPFFYSTLEAFTKRVATEVFFGLCVISITASALTAHTWAKSHVAQNQESFRRTLNAITNPEDYIVAEPPLHPICRRDTFYACLNTVDPSGHDTEEILEAIPLVRGHVSEQTYRDELDAHPPAVVVLWPYDFPQRQKAVLNKFLQEHGYINSEIGKVPVAVRPDHFERFLQKTQ